MKYHPTLLLGLLLMPLAVILVNCSAPSPPITPEPVILTAGCEQYTHLDIDWTARAPRPPIQSVSRPAQLAVHTLFIDETILDYAVAGGFDTIVQVLPWYTVEPQQNQFDWQDADRIVREVAEKDLNLVLRLDMPPQWAAGDDPYGFPFNLEGYLRFVTAVADRYRGHVLGYIIWNETNLAAEWSFSGQNLIFHYDLGHGRVAAPEQYAGLLGAAYQQIKAVDEQALVITAGMAPTNENSPRAVDDRRFLDHFLFLTKGECFDVLGAHVYDFGRDPLAPYEEDAISLSRIEDLKALLDTYEINRPIWITEIGYTVDSPYHPTVSQAEQADYLQGALERIETQWPWVQLTTVWNLSYGPGVEEEMAGYSLLASKEEVRPAFYTVQNFAP
ncbi:MAG: glycosyl hydrolase [Ardenticatenaceae bacterium]|nr:glycosyl hydrolase [Ardenticatenaceae bacterium]